MDFALDYYALNLRFKRSEGESVFRATDNGHDVDELDERRHRERGPCFSGTTTTIVRLTDRYVLKYCLTPGPWSEYRATET